ncbi:MAG: family 43 glycosylhydrolase, partial [Tannerellaceae bacterium]|nr:family 43 glycosylhydrolase [Tannerellaceae bacterium]
APFYPLYKSTDLVNWTQQGHIFEEQPEWTFTSFWAPELFYYNDKIYAYYTARNKENVSYIGVAVAEDTTMNFVDYGPVVEWGTEAIDAFILEDNGELYISWKAYGLDARPIELLAAKLSKDGLKLDGEPFSLLVDVDNIGMEGQHWFKNGDHYYILYSVKDCCGPGSDYEVYVARSANLRGPYEIYENNPILKGDGKNVLSCGHGTLTELADGRIFYLFHAYLTDKNFYGGRQGMLQEMVMHADGWPAFVGGNEVKLTQPTPFAGTIEKPLSPINDDFTSSSLAVYWTWNYPYAVVNTRIEDGKLYLSGSPKGNSKPGTALCVRPVVPDYSYETCISLPESDSFKGLTFYGDADNQISWGIINNKLQLKEVREGKEQVLFEATSELSGHPCLKIQIRNGTLATFLWSADGELWEEFSGEEKDLVSFVRWDRVARPGLIHQGSPDQPAVFDYFRMKNK